MFRTIEDQIQHVTHHWRKERIKTSDLRMAIRDMGLHPDVLPQYDLVRAYNPNTGEWVGETNE